MQFKNMIIAAGFAFAAAGCNQVDFKKTKTGLPYKHFESKSGKKVEEGKFVKAHVMQKIKDSVIFTTYTGLLGCGLRDGEERAADLTRLVLIDVAGRLRRRGSGEDGREHEGQDNGLAMSKHLGISPESVR